MHSYAHHRHSESGKASARETRGRILSGGWRYDLKLWFLDTFLLRGKLREIRQRTADLARIQPGERVLDVGCGTGTLAIEVQRRVGAIGRVFGVDPSIQQITRARSKAARRNLPIDFQIGVIERLVFPDQTFDVVFSTLMMHHLPSDLKRQGLSEIARVLKPGGRLVIADFRRSGEREGQRARCDAGGDGIQDLPALIRDAGFSEVQTEEMRLQRGRGVFVGLAVLLVSLFALGSSAIMRRSPKEAKAAEVRLAGARQRSALLRHSDDQLVEMITACHGLPQS